MPKAGLAKVLSLNLQFLVYHGQILEDDWCSAIAVLARCIMHIDCCHWIYLSWVLPTTSTMSFSELLHWICWYLASFGDIVSLCSGTILISWGYWNSQYDTLRHSQHLSLVPKGGQECQKCQPCHLSKKFRGAWVKNVGCLGLVGMRQQGTH